MSRIFVTGMGLISPLGDSVEKNRHALINGDSGLSTLELFPTNYAGKFRFGEIKISDESLKKNLDVRDRRVNRTSLLALHAINEVINSTRLTTHEIADENTALVGATTVGGMCFTDQLYNDANNAKNQLPFLYDYDSGSVNIFLAERFGMKGIINTINTACSSSANAIMFGARLIRQGFADRAIVGGTDSLSKFTINGFNALRILSSAECKPFDKHRDGLNLGEAAGFIVLENENVAREKSILAELSGYCNANDAHHPSSLSNEATGPFLAMKGALENAQLLPQNISFISTHGTGTENNDLVESIALKKVFNDVPPFGASKSNIGHTLGAAGIVQAIYSILSLQFQEIYQSLNFKEPIEETALRPVGVFQKTHVQHVLLNSFGFGGNCTSLIFSKV